MAWSRKEWWKKTYYAEKQERQELKQAAANGDAEAAEKLKKLEDKHEADLAYQRRYQRQAREQLKKKAANGDKAAQKKLDDHNNQNLSNYYQKKSQEEQIIKAAANGDAEAIKQVKEIEKKRDRHRAINNKSLKKARATLREAAKNGDPEAIKKLEDKKIRDTISYHFSMLNHYALSPENLEKSLFMELDQADNDLLQKAQKYINEKLTQGNITTKEFDGALKPSTLTISRGGHFRALKRNYLSPADLEKSLFMELDQSSQKLLEKAQAYIAEKE